MRWLNVIANAWTAAVTVICAFTPDQWANRRVDMIIIGLTIWGVLNKLDDIYNKLNEK